MSADFLVSRVPGCARMPLCRIAEFLPITIENAENLSCQFEGPFKALHMNAAREISLNSVFQTVNQAIKYAIYQLRYIYTTSNVLIRLCSKFVPVLWITDRQHSSYYIICSMRYNNGPIKICLQTGCSVFQKHTLFTIIPSPPLPTTPYFPPPHSLLLQSLTPFTHLAYCCGHSARVYC